MPGRVNQEETTKADPMTREQRAAQMAKVRGSGNRSTERLMESLLIESGIQGWEKHPKQILGKPDFFFPGYRLVIFVDGCFWHGCPVCKRRTPKSDFWRKKLEDNVRRDNRVHRKLRQEGYHVIRFWEHDLKQGLWLRRLRTMIQKIEKSNSSKV